MTGSHFSFPRLLLSARDEAKKSPIRYMNCFPIVGLFSSLRETKPHAKSAIHPPRRRCWGGNPDILITQHAFSQCLAQWQGHIHDPLISGATFPWGYLANCGRGGILRDHRVGPTWPQCSLFACAPNHTEWDENSLWTSTEI